MDKLIGQGPAKGRCLWYDCDYFKADDKKMREKICTKNTEVSPEVIAKLDERKVTCPRCRLKLRILQQLIERQPDAFKEGVSGICEHCLAKQVPHEPICTCDKTFKQFMEGFDKSSKQQDDYFNRLLQSFAPKSFTPKTFRPKSYLPESFLPKVSRGVPLTEKFKPHLPLLRRWHSEESMMDSFSNIRERDFKKNLNYFFPQLDKDTGVVGKRHSSEEIIQQTADRLKAENLRRLGMSESDEDLYDYIIDPSTGKAILKLRPSVISDDNYNYFIDPYSGKTFRKPKEIIRFGDEPFEDDDLHYDYITDPLTGKTVKRPRQRMSLTEEDMYEYVTDPQTGKTVKKFKRRMLPADEDTYEYVTDPFTGKKVRKRKKRISPADEDMYEYVTDPVTGKVFKRRISPTEDEYVYERVTDPLTGKTVRKLRKRISSLEEDIYEYYTDPSTGKMVRVPRRRISSADENMYEYVTDPYSGQLVRKLIKRRMLPHSEDLFDYVTDPTTGKTVKVPRTRISSADEDMYEYVTDPYSGKIVKKLRKRMLPPGEDLYEYVTDPTTGKKVKVPRTRMTSADEDMYEYVTDPYSGKIVKMLRRRIMPPGEDLYEYITDPITGKTVKVPRTRMTSADEDMYEYVTDPYSGKIVKKLGRRRLPPGEDLYEYVTDPTTGKTVKVPRTRMTSADEDMYEYVTEPFTGKMVKKLKRRMLPSGEDIFEYVTDPTTGKTIRKIRKRLSSLPEEDVIYEYLTDPSTGKTVRVPIKSISPTDETRYEYVTDPLTGKTVKTLRKRDEYYDYATDPFTGKTVKTLKKPGEDIYEYVTDPFTGKTVRKIQRRGLPSGEDMYDYEYYTDPITGKKVKKFKRQTPGEDYEYVTDPYTGKTVKKKKKHIPADEGPEYFTDPFTGKVYQKVKMRVSPSDDNLYEFIIDPFTGEKVQQLKKERKPRILSSDDEMYETVTDPFTGKTVTKLKRAKTQRGPLKILSSDENYEYVIDPITGQKVLQGKDGEILRGNKKMLVSGKDMFQYAVDPVTGKIKLQKMKTGHEVYEKDRKGGEYDDQLAARRMKKVKKGKDAVDADIYIKHGKRKLADRSVTLLDSFAGKRPQRSRSEMIGGKRSLRSIRRNIFGSDTETLSDPRVKKSRAAMSTADVLPKYLKVDLSKRQLKGTKSLPTDLHFKKRDVLPLPKYIRELQATSKKKLKVSKSVPSDLHDKRSQKSIVFEPRQPRTRSPEDKKRLKAIYSQLLAPEMDITKKKKSDVGDKDSHESKKKGKAKGSDIFKSVKEKTEGDKKKKKESGAKTEHEDGKDKKTDDVALVPQNAGPQELILRLIEQREQHRGHQEKSDHDHDQLPDLPNLRKRRKKRSESSNNTSDLELDKDDANYVFEDSNEIIKGTRIRKRRLEEYEDESNIVQILFDDEELNRPFGSVESVAIKPTLDVSDDEHRFADSKKAGKLTGVFKYALSDRQYIENGYTVLPTTKTFRKINLYRMRPAQPELDWFERNKENILKYPTGEKLAEVDKKGRGKWFYKNGKVALEYYNTKDTHAQHRFVIRSSGQPNEHGRSQPVTVLGIFDHFGGGVIFDHSGKIRIKYNQSEGVVLDRKIGPVSHWQWHSLNHPPILQQVLVNATLSSKDPVIASLGKTYELPTRKRKDDEEMLTLEYENYIKENSFVQKPYKPFKISTKTVKINKQFTLKIMDQSRIHLTFRDGAANMKINLGMLLDPKELVDTDIAEIGSSPSETAEPFGGRTRSMEQLTLDLKIRRQDEAKRLERDIRIRKPVSELTVDALTAPLSRPLKPITNNVFGYNTCYCDRKVTNQNNKYYSTSIFN